MLIVCLVISVETELSYMTDVTMGIRAVALAHLFLFL